MNHYSNNMVCNQNDTPPPISHPIPPIAPNTPPVQATIPPPNVVQAPTANVPSESTLVTGGGTQVYCSGPTAPGWRVDLKDGGCPDHSQMVGGSPIVVHLNQLPVTGGIDLTAVLFCAALSLALTVAKTLIWRS